jgi:hypothetical protein
VVWAPTIDLAAIHARLRGLPFVHVCATALSLTPLDLVVWAKADAGSVNLYRSQHELLLLFTSEINNDPRLPLVCWFSDARITGASTRGGSRRPPFRDEIARGEAASSGSDRSSSFGFWKESIGCRWGGLRCATCAM